MTGTTGTTGRFGFRATAPAARGRGSSGAPRHRRSGLARRGAVVAAVVVAATSLAGCSSARSSLGTVDGGCFVALPTASAAVHRHGQLLGAELVTVDALRSRPLVYRTAVGAPGPKVRQVCLVAFGGSFTTRTVERPAGHAEGRLAVAVVEYPRSRLLGTVLLSRPPVRFGHSHAG